MCVCVGDEPYAEGAGDGLPPPGSPYYLTDPSQLWYIHTVTLASLALDSSAHVILNTRLCSSSGSLFTPQDYNIRRAIAHLSHNSDFFSCSSKFTSLTSHISDLFFLRISNLHLTISTLFFNF